MASSAPNESLAVRAAAIMTTSEVAGTSLDLNSAWGSRATVQIDFTLGSATNGIFRFYVSQDGSTWYTLYGATGAVLTQTLTANSTIAIPVHAAGWKFLRVSVQGTGTMTSSSATVTARYLRRGSQ
jgi:hypothetical protein